MIGFSVPIEGQILVVSYEGTHIIRLDEEVTVESDDEFAEYDIYDPATGFAQYHGRDYQIIGLHPGTPILDSPRGERLELDTKAGQFSVMKNGEVVFSDQYENLSGDWAVVTFSPDGIYVVLGCPYDFDFRIYERVV